MAAETWYHDTKVLIWLDDPKDPKCREVFDQVNLILMDLGFLMGKDARIEKEYTCLGPGRRHGWRFDLHVKTSLSGRCIEAHFFQNKVIDNKNGNEYDFNIFKMMPYVMRLEFIRARNRIFKWCSDNGIPTRVDKKAVAVTPLDHFNAGWGYDRFDRDESGWPSDKELKSWDKKDADGAMLTHGARRYVWCRRSYRWISAQVYGGINAMWQGYVGNTSITNEPAVYYTSKFPGRGRTWQTNRERAQMIDKHYVKAIQAADIQKAAAILKYRNKVLPNEPAPKIKIDLLH